jgi:hypothetical protein
LPNWPSRYRTQPIRCTTSSAVSSSPLSRPQFRRLPVNLSASEDLDSHLGSKPGCVECSMLNAELVLPRGLGDVADQVEPLCICQRCNTGATLQIIPADEPRQRFGWPVRLRPHVHKRLHLRIVAGISPDRADVRPDPVRHRPATVTTQSRCESAGVWPHGGSGAPQLVWQLRNPELSRQSSAVAEFFPPCRVFATAV